MRKEKELYQNIVGRLGNQMFQYAFSAIMLRKLKISKVLCKFEEKFPSCLDIFGIDIKSFENYDFSQKQKNGKRLIEYIERVTEKLRSIKLMSWFIEKIIFLIGCFCGYYPSFKHYHKFLFLNKRTFISGYFEDLRFFKKHKEYILDLYVPKCGITEDIADYVHKAKTYNSVCVSVRRGDFLSSTYRDVFYVCDEKYFYRGIDYIKKVVDNPVFFVFSDDIKWCKSNMIFPPGTIFEDGSNSLGEKIVMMTSCKHFIISNSTFSWWCQFLCANGEKVVVAPKYWRKKMKTTKKISDSSWVLL